MHNNIIHMVSIMINIDRILEKKDAESYIKAVEESVHP